MGSLDAVRDQLTRAQSAIFRAADSIHAEKWNCPPELGEWSAAELVAHLVVIERAVLASADRVTQKLPKEISLLKRVHLPLWLVEYRVVRLKSPIPQDSELLTEKEDMLAELRAARERTLAFLSETEKRDLRVYCWRHPFLGMLNTYEWIEMLAAHQVRHTKQMREIEEKLSRKT